MRRYLLITMLALTPRFADLWGLQPPPIAVTIGYRQQSTQKFADTVMDIHLKNLSDHTVTIPTIGDVPPVTLFAFDEKGNMAIPTNPPPKDRTTKNVDYSLAANQTKDYVAPIRQLLHRGQTLPETEPVGAVRIYALLSIVEFNGKSYDVVHISSNTLTIPATSDAR